jgi:hypothetical protein
MFHEVQSSNPLDLPVPGEGAYTWHMEVIVVEVIINPVSREYDTNPVVDFTSDKKETFCILNHDPFLHIFSGARFSSNSFS